MTQRLPLSGYLLRVVRGDLPLVFDGAYGDPGAVAVAASYGAERESLLAVEADRFGVLGDTAWWAAVADGHRDWAGRYQQVERVAWTLSG